MRPQSGILFAAFIVATVLTLTGCSGDGSTKSPYTPDQIIQAASDCASKDVWRQPGDRLPVQTTSPKKGSWRVTGWDESCLRDRLPKLDDEQRLHFEDMLERARVRVTDN